ncbi:6-phospho-3-hexuloisomerase [Paenibacillus physcomitrellae]|uniref:3-hexulose-6-phosphate isomerase n=1 Tax=Paenibacillus physcomitrellae TaxID=1619311 RepID=A0ABQ1FYB0_9BACL|nr:6-phospho-3-hexuloisomerase [Paenibacillus physcomitrellae]GGA33213.1 3-hexulose-6-phosphate isomerase [Paenibacillus physcomitrellae]
MSASSQLARLIASELEQSAQLIADSAIAELADKVLGAEQVFLAGAGRSGLMGRAFAMRLMHAGIPAYVVGETITPGITERDLLVIGSGSGETASLVQMANKAKTAKASVAVVTINPASSLGSICDLAVKLPGAVKDRSRQDQMSETRTVQPMGSLFEQTLLVFYDAVILRIMEQKGLEGTRMYGNHANLE